MLGTRREDSVKQMTRVLEEERDALITGALERLEALAGRKERALEQLRSKSPEEQEMTALHEMAQSNQRLLDAAAEGLRAGFQRIAQLQESLRGWRAYDSQGQRSAIGASSGSLERKA